MSDEPSAERTPLPEQDGDVSVPDVEGPAPVEDSHREEPHRADVPRIEVRRFEPRRGKLLYDLPRSTGRGLPRGVLLGLGVLVPTAVLVVSIWSIVRDVGQRAVTSSAESPTRTQAESPLQAPTGAVTTPDTPAPAPSAMALAPPSNEPGPPLSEFFDETDDGEPGEQKPPPRRYTSVQQAAADSCSTASIEGLSRQIIEQARCIKPNAFVPLPTRANLVFGTSVFPYLEMGARTHLLRVLDANPSKKMTINSALRTVAQQYLVSRWAAGRRCGVQLATKPGESNHELGTALDIAEPSQWRPALEQHNFRWMGSSDRVHFDYTGGSSSPTAKRTDVLAFQILWNRNHTTDLIPADGFYAPATEQRLKKAPPDGFPLGPLCGKSSSSKKP